MPLENAEQLALLDMPETNGFVITGGGQQLAIGTKGQAINGSFMGLELGDLATEIGRASCRERV